MNRNLLQNQPTGPALWRWTVFLILTLLLGALQSVQATVKTWSGASNGYWNVAANWTGNVAPVNGDDLVFPSGATRYASTNNLANLRANSVTFTGSGYDLVNYPTTYMTISNGISGQQASGANTIELIIELGAVQTFDCINAGGTMTYSGTFTNSGYTLTFNGSGAINIGVGPGGTTMVGTGGVTKNGTGSLTYAGYNNTYTGTTRVNNGILFLETQAYNDSFRGPLIIGDSSGATGTAVVRFLFGAVLPKTAITINSDGLLDLNGRNDTAGSMTLYGGGAVQTGLGLLTLADNSTLTVYGPSAPEVAGNLNIGTNGTCTWNVDSPGWLNVHASVGGAAALAKGGSGSAYLYSSNYFTGALTVNSAGLWIGNSWACGATNGTVTVNDPAWLTLGGGISVNNKPLVVNSTSSQALNGETTSNAWTGPITINSAAGVQVQSGGDLSLVGPITGSGGFTKIGPGSLWLSGSSANGYTGITRVNQGTLLLNKSSGWAIASGSLFIGDGAGVDVVRYTGTSSSLLNTSVPITITNGGTLDLNGKTDDVGPITLGGGSITTGAGLLKLDGNVTAVAGTSSTISGHASLDAPGLVFTSGDVNAVLYLAADLSSTLSSYGLTKAGAGALHLPSANTYGGLTVVQGGWLDAESAGALGSTASGTVVSNGASLVLVGGITITGEALTLNGPGESPVWGALDVESSSSTWAGPITLNATSTLDAYNPGSALHINGVISGPGGLELFGLGSGGGTLYFEGGSSNTYAGTTTVDAGGTLCLNKGTFDGAIPDDLLINGTVRNLQQNQISNSGAVTIGASGLLDLSLGGDALGSLDGSGNVTLGAGTFINLVGSGSHTYNGVISGAGTFYMDGNSLTCTLNNNNTYTGQTHLYDNRTSTLIVNGSQPQSPVYVGNLATLGGTGTVGPIQGNGTVAPGTSPGILTCSNMTFSASGKFNVDLTGPNAGTDYDQLNVRGTNSLANAGLGINLAFTKPVAVGQKFTIINNDGADPITGIFAAYPEGTTFVQNGYAVSISYVGGTGNNVVLTLTAVPGAAAGSSISLGNGSGTIDPNECNSLSVVLTNQTGTPMTGISATLASTTANVAVTQPFSAYSNVPASGKGTNSTPFQISTAPAFACGTTINLSLIVTTATHGSFTVPVVLNSGSPSTLPVRYDVGVLTNIPDIGTIESTNVVSGFSSPLEKVAVSLWLTHPVDSDLSLSLVSPGGVVVPLTINVGGGANFGTACSPDASRTTFDDSAAGPITAGTPPFVGTFRPQGSLASFINTTANGNWRLRITDSVGGSQGALRCWSLFLYPVTCTGGGGLCELCPNVTIAGATGPATPTQNGYVNYNSVPSTCAAPKACPGTTATGTYPSDNYTFRNGPSAACVTVTVENDSPSVLMLATVYLGSFNLAGGATCSNYLADSGFSLDAANPIRTFSFQVAANATFVVNLIANSTTSAPYKLTVSGGDCRPALRVTPAGPGKVQLDWTTASAGYGLEQTNRLAGSAGNWTPMTNVPVVVNSRFMVTNSAASGPQFYQLHKK